ncbi:MAG: hypothetical protein HY822_21150 [Acidobacteria bacterium]|nr:hypothetical protein [Acidobacteriota bacterium]
MRRLLPVLILTLAAFPSPAATLEKLTLDDMVEKSTAIVRGKVLGMARVTQSGPLIYTHWKVQVGERWKGPVAGEVEVVTPGGVLGGMRQVFPGVPALEAGSEYVMFLWTGKSNRTHVIGLSQGLFDLKADAAGNPMVSRTASAEVMLDPKTGREVGDEAVRMRLSELDGRIRRAMAAAVR